MAINYDKAALMAINTDIPEGMKELRSILMQIKDKVNPDEGSRIYNTTWKEFGAAKTQSKKNEIKEKLCDEMAKAFPKKEESVVVEYHSPEEVLVEYQSPPPSPVRAPSPVKPKYADLASVYKNDLLKDYDAESINIALDKLMKNLKKIEKKLAVSNVKEELKDIKDQKNLTKYAKKITEIKDLDQMISLYVYHYLKDCLNKAPGKPSPAKPKAASPVKPKASPAKPKVASPAKPKVASPKAASPKPVISPNFIKGKAEEYLLGILIRYHPGKNIESVKDYNKMSTAAIPGTISKLQQVKDHIASRDVDVKNVPIPSAKNKEEVVKALLKAIRIKLAEDLEEVVKDEKYYKNLLKDKKFKENASLSYLMALHDGKKCDYDAPCDDGQECDLENQKCVPETNESYYDDLERKKYNGKSFVGSHSKIEKLASPKAPSPKAPSPKKASPKAPSPKKASPKAPSPKDEVSEDEVEAIDLEDIVPSDLSKLSELQKALVECLMPSNKASAREIPSKFKPRK